MCKIGILPQVLGKTDADGAKRPEVQKLIIVYDNGFFHQLHIAPCCVCIYNIQSFWYSFSRWCWFKTAQNLTF